MRDYFKLTPALLILFLIGCSGTEKRLDEPVISQKSAREVAEALRNRFLDLDAVRELKSAGKEGAEFVSDVFKKAGRLIPRTTSDLARHGSKVKRDETRVGDLVFFRTGFFSKHVGIYIGMNRFVHSTQDEGVLISNIKDPYWKKAFWQTRRVLEF